MDIRRIKAPIAAAFLILGALLFAAIHSDRSEPHLGAEIPQTIAGAAENRATTSERMASARTNQIPFRGTEIDVSYTDDNTGECFIIRGLDNAILSGIAYEFTVENTCGVDETNGTVRVHTEELDVSSIDDVVLQEKVGTRIIPAVYEIINLVPVLITPTTTEDILDDYWEPQNVSVLRATSTAPASYRRGAQRTGISIGNGERRAFRITWGNGGFAGGNFGISFDGDRGFGYME